MPNDLAEALLAAGVPQLQPKIIDPMMLELQRRFAPLVRAISSFQYGADTYTFNQRLTMPGGGFVLDGGARPQTQSTYNQTDWKMKHLQVQGAITKYAELVTKAVVGSLRQQEIEGSIKGLMLDLELAITCGNAGSTAFGAYPEFDGFDSFSSNYSGSTQNAMDFSNSTLSTGLLDQIADMVQVNTADNIYSTDWMWVMSPTANTRIGQLVQQQQRFTNLLEIEPGVIVANYKNIPIMPTSFLSARSYGVGTVSTSTNTAGGSLAAATYYYRVSAVIARHGEIQASVEVSQATSGSSSTVTLNLPVVSGLDAAGPIHYKVWRSTSTGQESLLGYVDAVVGLDPTTGAPIPTTSIVDTGQLLQPRNGAIVPAQGPGSYVGTNPARKPAQSGSESIFLVPRAKNQLCRPYVRDIEPLDVNATQASPDSLPYTLQTDTVLALRDIQSMGQGSRISTQLAS